MASPRTGRPRGRPRKPKPPARPRGNQPYDFFRDPDRYAIALLDVLLADGAGSARDLSFAIAAWQVGIEAESPSGAKHPGLVATHWLTKRTIPGARAATLEGRAATLRQKQARKTIPTAQAEWRTTMASCFQHRVWRARPGPRPSRSARAGSHCRRTRFCLAGPLPDDRLEPGHVRPIFCGLRHPRHGIISSPSFQLRQ